MFADAIRSYGPLFGKGLGPAISFPSDNGNSAWLTDTSTSYHYLVNTRKNSLVDLVCMVCINEKQGCNQTAGSRGLGTEPYKGFALSIHPSAEIRPGNRATSEKGFTHWHTA